MHAPHNCYCSTDWEDARAESYNALQAPEGGKQQDSIVVVVSSWQKGRGLSKIVSSGSRAERETLAVGHNDFYIITAICVATEEN